MSMDSFSSLKRRKLKNDFIKFSTDNIGDLYQQMDEYIDPASDLIQREYIKQLYSTKRPFANTKKTPELLQILTAFLIASFVFYFTVTVSNAHVIPTTRIESEHNVVKRDSTGLKEDFLCNVDSDFECVCNRSAGNLDDTVIQCNALIADEKIPSVDIIIKNIDLSSRLHTNETYQDYFRRRVANIVSQYCEKEAHDCAGAQLSLHKVNNNGELRSEPNKAPSNSKNKDLSINKAGALPSSTLPIHRLNDDDEPLLTQANVLIMHVEYLPRKRILMKFVVRKQPDLMPKMTEADLIAPGKIVNILTTQVGPLSRVLGGIRIESLHLGSIERQTLPADNTTLIIMITVVMVSILFCYVIAFYKCISDRRQKRTEAKRSESLANKDQKNYGACSDKLDAPNNINKATRSSTSSRSSVLNNNNNNNEKCRRTSNGKDGGRLTARSSTKRSVGDDNSIGICDLQNSQPSSPPPSANTDTRSFQRMFACDMSQLPAESLDDGYSGEVFLEESISQEAIESPNVFYSQQQNNSQNNFYVGSVCNSHQNSHVFNPETEGNVISHNSPPLETLQMVQRAVPIVVENMGSEPKLNYDENDNHIHEPPPPAPKMEIKNELAEVENEESPPPNVHVSIMEPEYNEIELPVPHFEVSKTPRGSLDNEKDQQNIENNHEELKLSNSLLDAITHNGPYERPLSRRGSRDSPREEGEEEVVNEKCATPPPIGDRGMPLKIPQLSIDFADDDIITKPKNKRYADWSSDSEDETNEPYQTLAEEDELELEEIMKNDKSDALRIEDVPARPLSRNSTPMNHIEANDYYTSSSESEVDETYEENGYDRPYERLAEISSPIIRFKKDMVAFKEMENYADTDPALLYAAVKTAAQTVEVMNKQLGIVYYPIIERFKEVIDGTNEY
ncbi:unnamed protein product [Bursaphelenchus okinawaensis]|uniref:Uncharacterized protein n=1 Tax=Bursaphelenchus okinawaensis TaxID=465554 RepID=A0A811KMY8_9BILA|nr:unnamed protein product [Bursaphelenchus okinawaensis]CAG9106350.1 unnamed protein product [Bursaphelenchus okinawaensis]